MMPMKPLRAGFALALAAVLLLPYVSPVLCTALASDLTMVACSADDDPAGQQTRDRCDVPGCATAPAAPIAAATLASAAPATNGGSPISSPDAPLDVFAAPLIPPPRA